MEHPKMAFKYLHNIYSGIFDAVDDLYEGTGVTEQEILVYILNEYPEYRTESKTLVDKNLKLYIAENIAEGHIVRLFGPKGPLALSVVRELIYSMEPNVFQSIDNVIRNDKIRYQYSFGDHNMVETRKVIKTMIERGWLLANEQNDIKARENTIFGLGWKGPEAVAKVARNRNYSMFDLDKKVNKKIADIRAVSPQLPYHQVLKMAVDRVEAESEQY